MHNLIRVTLLTLFLLVIIRVFNLETHGIPIHFPSWLLKFQKNIQTEFDSPQNAHFLFSVLTGSKSGLGARLLNDLSTLNLRFLLSPVGIHLTGYLFFLKRKNKLRAPIYLLIWFLPNFFALKRLALMRFLSLFTKKISRFNLMYFTFFISFLCGHFFDSPMGFVFSFLIIGTFFSISELSFFQSFLALSSGHILIAIFLGNEFSFIGLFFTMIIVQVFSYLLPLFFIFILTFLLYPSHWIEPLIRGFILLIHHAALLTQGTFLTSSFMILFIIWTILLRKKKEWIIFFMILHSGLAETPFIIREHQGRAQSRII